MILTHLRRHRVRTAIGATGIALGVATMLCVVGLLGGAVKMFEQILRNDSQMVVFEKNVSDLFFSNVPVGLVAQLEAQPCVKDAQPVLFAVISAPGRSIITCFGIQASDGRLRRGTWLQGSAAAFTDDADAVVLGERTAGFLNASAGGTVQLGQGTYQVAGVVRVLLLVPVCCELAQRLVHQHVNNRVRQQVIRLRDVRTLVVLLLRLQRVGCCSWIPPQG